MEGAVLLVFALFIASWTPEVIGQAVTVGFSQTSYTFNEDEGGLVCVIVLEGAIQNEAMSVTLTINATDGSATGSDNDYNSSLLDITISPSTPSMGECISSTILPDGTPEGNESFTLTLIENEMVNLSPTMSQTQIVIVNDDAACPRPPGLTDGSFTLSTREPSGVSARGVTATYSCSLGYTLEGPDKLTCQLGNVWSPTAPGTCQTLKCPPLTDPDNGQVMAPSISLFSTAVYSCNNGYELMGERERMCFLGFVWTHSAPTCQAKDCGTLTPPENGTVEYVNTTFSSEASYSCGDELILEGDSTRICQADGNWSSSEPTCRPATTCPELNLINGSISSNSELPYTEGETITYICDKGYILTGNTTRTCLANGWTGSSSTCTIVDCGALSSPEGGRVEHAMTTYLSVASYSCDNNLRLIGPPNRQCLNTGDWEGSTPTCGAMAITSSGVLLLLVMTVLLNIFL